MFCGQICPIFRLASSKTSRYMVIIYIVMHSHIRWL